MEQYIWIAVHPHIKANFKLFFLIKIEKHLFVKWLAAYQLVSEVCWFVPVKTPHLAQQQQSG